MKAKAKVPTKSSALSTASKIPAKSAPSKLASIVSSSSPPTSRPGSKMQICLDLLSRRNGATLADLMAASGWQAHSVRGFLSGTVKKKMGLAVSSEAGKDGVRRYRVQDVAKAG